jgi:pheophorbide a oxygenase
MSFEGDRLLLNVAIFMTPVTATSCRGLFRNETYVPARSWTGRILRNLPKWGFHVLFDSTILDGDMVFLHRQSMKLMHGRHTWKDYFMPAPADMGTRELWRHFDTYSPEGINYYPHEVDSKVLPPEQVLDRYEQHVKNCKYCRGALQNVRRAMWASLSVAVSAIATAVVAVVACEVRGATGGWQVGLGGVMVAAVAFKVWQFMKGFEKKFMFEPYIHQDKN